MSIVNKFNVNGQVTNIKVASTANDISYDSSTQYDKNTVGDKLSELESELIYDISSHNNGSVFESLKSLLSSSNLSTLIPVSVRCGGMSIRFIQSSDNKYVQYRLMSQSFSITESDWQSIGLTQEKGQSTTVTMSQKAITRELDKINTSTPLIGDDTSEVDLNISDGEGNVIAELKDGHIKTKNFDSRNVEKYNFNDVETNKQKLSGVLYFIKNKIVNKQNRCLVSFNGDSIIGSQLDDIALSPEYSVGNFPPNLSKMIMARMFYDRYKFSGEDTQFRNLIHSDWTKVGTWNSRIDKTYTFNEIETYTPSSLEDYAQITVSGYKFFKLVWSECCNSGYSFDILISIDNDEFKKPSEVDIELPDTVSYNKWTNNSTCLMQRYVICEFDSTHSYTIKIQPTNSPTGIAFWGCEYWNNPRLDVVVQAYSGSTSFQQVFSILNNHTTGGMREAYWSNWHKPMLVITDILYINDQSYIWNSSETIEGWMEANAFIYEICKSKGIPVLSMTTHVSNKLSSGAMAIAINNNLAFIDILEKMKKQPPTDKVTNNTDGLHLSNYGNSYYFDELKKIFD